MPEQITTKLPASLEDYAFVALGSNLGDSVQVMREAASAVAGAFDICWCHRSCRRAGDCARSPPDCSTTSWAPAAGAETPESLLLNYKRCKKFGRQPTDPKRTASVGLTYHLWTATRNTAPLILPHPRAHQRRFVLQPLAEIAPDLILAGQTKTVAALLAALDTNETVTRLA